MSESHPAPAVRTFVALPLSPELLDAVREVQRRLSDLFGPDAVRWTKREQLHLTLRFLGNVAQGDLSAIAEAVRRAAQPQPPFSLSLAGLGCFPSSRRPSVIWLGVEGGLEGLRALQSAVDRETAPWGSHTEMREFQPHLTIGRVRAVGLAARRVGEAVGVEVVEKLGSWPVRKVSFIKSELTPVGSVYEILASAPLG